jgi:hypothetical protein
MSVFGAVSSYSKIQQSKRFIGVNLTPKQIGETIYNKFDGYELS